MPLPRWLFWNHLAEDLLATGRGLDVRDYLQRAVAQAPDARLLCLLGRSHQFAGDLDEAERCFRGSSALDDTYDLPRLYLGQIALQRGRLAEARDFLRHALALSPGRYETVYNMALVYRRLGDDVEAARWNQQAERLRKERLRND